ncbi:MAG: sulfate/thiosulfate transport system permease protein [Actinomycetota bacterium]|nr:sulfate/thiosulfate transport system permease protein [Actinomycetota bacterium]
MASVDGAVAVRGSRRPLGRYGLRFVALGYLFVLLAAPVAMVFYRAFQHGVGPIWSALTTSEARSAIEVTVIVAVAAVVLNTVFGVGAALLLVRRRFPGRHLLDVLVDIPQAVSPIVVGLALILVYGKFGFFGSWIERNGLKIIFSLPGMVLATAFVSLPLVVRSVAPVLAEIGDEQEQAARTLGASSWQTFRRITLPSIRDALAYGVVLSLARSLGEYGAVTVVSGHVVGKTLTLTLFIDERLQNFDQPAAYSAAVLLAIIAMGSLLISRRLRTRSRSTA